MRYISSRGGIDPLSFSQAVMMGLATDGGLLLPEQIPTVPAATLRQWASWPFTSLASEIVALFVGDDIPRNHLDDLVQRSYRHFTHAAITPVIWAGGRPILELFHGPTLAFKDVALQLLGNLFEYLLQRDGGRLNILGATSGDTGSAAIHGVRGKAGIHIFMIHPHQRVSPVQERQMTSVLDDNVHNIAICGTFDDGQRIVKDLFNDLAFRQKYHLGAVNSINWARILAQIVYYFHAWGQVTGGDASRPVTFSVPTGNFGDIFAGYMAQRMGLPIERLILATNCNDILTRFMRTGSYQTGTVQPTISPSMDIQVSSNFERFLFYLLDQDGALVRQRMNQFHTQGQFSVNADQLQQANRIFTARAVSEQQTLEQMRQLYQTTGYISDPHTAVGLAAAAEWPEAICLATAHPAKFAAAVQQAIGHDPDQPPPLQGLMAGDTRCTILPAETNAIRAHMVDTLASL
ncbi:MAG: threonine synthase [Magnetococcales bacterium]|nr:threonine synthase [Magnetococcales bacterium]